MASGKTLCKHAYLKEKSSRKWGRAKNYLGYYELTGSAHIQETVLFLCMKNILKIRLPLIDKSKASSRQLCWIFSHALAFLVVPVGAMYLALRRNQAHRQTTVGCSKLEFFCLTLILSFFNIGPKVTTSLRTKSFDDN